MPTLWKGTGDANLRLQQPVAEVRGLKLTSEILTVFNEH